MSTDALLHDEQQLLPWGNVTPAFWEPEPGQAGDPVAPPGEMEAEASGPSVSPSPADSAPVPVRAAGAAHGRPDPAASDDGMPPEYHPRFALIVAAFQAPEDLPRVRVAATAAEALDRELTARYGDKHPNTVNIREFRGWLALLTGHPDVATQWYLHTTGRHVDLHGPAHELTQSSARRAFHAWSLVKEPGPVLALGAELVTMLALVMGEESEATAYARQRISRNQPVP